VTQLPPAQPMSRRERRLLEQQGPPAAPVQPALEDAVAPPSPPHQAPVYPPVVEEVARPLSRRELRQAERGGAPGAQELGSPGSSTTLPTQSLAEPLTLETVPVATQPPPTDQQAVVPQEPLPPVFGVVTQAHGSEGEGWQDQAPSRLVGDVSSATSSLIMPTTPMVDMTSPLSSTGEVVVTGQIRLPSRIAETGSAPVLDYSPDQDEVMDAYVTGEMAAMSKPVRASHAVSGKGDDTDIFLVRKARWGTAAIVTALVAACLGLAAVGLLLLALLTDVLR